MSGRILFLDLLVAAVNLYFHFQFLTDMAALAEQYQPQKDDLDWRLHRRRTVYVVLMTAIDLVIELPDGLLGDWQEWVTIGMAVIAFIVSALIMVGLFELRQYFREGETAG